MYSRACTGFRAVLGPSCNECQYLERSIASLDPTQGTRDSGGTRARVDTALNRNAKKRKLLR